MNKFLIGVGIVLAILVLYRIWKVSEGMTIISSKALTASDVKKSLESEKFDYVLDVRIPEQFEKGHYDKAANLPIEKFRWDLEKIVPNKKAKILLMCNEGDHALAAGAIAERMGYKNTFYLDKASYKDL